MQDLERLRQELERQGKLSALKTLADTPEAAALQRQVSPERLKRPENMQAELKKLLQTPEGQALARRIREAMEHG